MQIGPQRLVPAQFRFRQIQRRIGGDAGGEGGIIGGIGGQRRAGGFRIKQQPVEGHFGECGFHLRGGVINALGKARPAEPRAVRIGGAITEGRRKKIIETGAFRRKRPLARLQNIFQQRLLLHRIHQFHGGNLMLRFHQPPVFSRCGAFFRQERVGRPDRRGHRSIR
ncbi:hypothetical protein D3C80_1486100 [compost metagenome]